MTTTRMQFNCSIWALALNLSCSKRLRWTWGMSMTIYWNKMTIATSRTILRTSTFRKVRNNLEQTFWGLTAPSSIIGTPRLWSLGLSIYNGTMALIGGRTSLICLLSSLFWTCLGGGSSIVSWFKTASSQRGSRRVKNLSFVSLTQTPTVAKASKSL